MQTLTFTQKLLRQRRFLSFLFPLFAVFVGLGASQQAMAQANFYRNKVVASGTTESGSTVGPKDYYAKGSFGTTRPTFNGVPFGSFSLTSGSLTINPTATISGKLPEETLSPTVSFLYRVYLSGTPRPNFMVGTLNNNNTGNGTSASDLATYTSVGPINLLSSLQAGGSYIVEIGYSTIVTTCDNSTTPPFCQGADVADIANNGNGYQATFTVPIPDVAPPGSTTTWIGGAAGAPNDWLTPANWSNGVPNARSSAIIPSPPRPNPPILANNTANYSVKNLTLQVQDPANAFTTRGILRVTTATLKIYGDVANGGNGILATTDAPGTVADPLSASATIVFAGEDQKIDQGRFANLIIQSNDVNQNTGAVTPNPITSPQVVKSVFGVLEIPGSLQFANNTSALLRSTVTDLQGNLLLDTGGNENVDLKNTGSVVGETNLAFMQGIMKVQRPVNIDQKETFGGIGLDITITGSATAGIGQLTRVTGATFSPVIYSGATRPVSVKRAFGVSFSGLQQGFNADVVFHYNNNADELNTNRDGFLSIFRTVSGSTFQNLRGVNKIDPTTYPGSNGTVEVLGLNNINTLTLADYETNPLPVTLSAFSAKRIASDAVVTWATAQEINNKGFNVQVSTDAKNYRNIGFVKSETPNSTNARDYSFTDTEKNKVGVRYYRLQQLDVDGKSAFFSPRAVTFEGLATEAGIVTYPNPYTTELRVSMTSAMSGKAFVRITDMTGRLVSQQVMPVNIGTNDLPVENMNGLKNGLYLLNLTLPSGETKTMKVMKQ